jgi:hypothetical protein
MTFQNEPRSKNLLNRSIMNNEGAGGRVEGEGRGEK